MQGRFTLQWFANRYILSATLLSGLVFANFVSPILRVEAQCLSCPEQCHAGSSCPLGFGNPSDWCAYTQTGCPNGQTLQGTCCCDTTPVLLDLNNDGFELTDAYDGVRFDIGTDGHLDLVAWTKANSDDAWLVLDRNGNGRIDNGSELFGNMAPQPESNDRNGFRALAVYDLAANGGNGDGIISSSDVVFTQLRLWTDRNHNAISEEPELHFVLVQREDEGWEVRVRVRFRPAGGDFQGMRIYRSDGICCWAA
jgi:hypothetical protein